MKKLLFLSAALALNFCLSVAGGAQARIYAKTHAAEPTVSASAIVRTDGKARQKDREPRRMPRVKKDFKAGNPV